MRVLGGVKSFVSDALDAYLLRDVARAVRARTEPQRLAVARLHDAATKRIDAAAQLSPAGDAAVVIRLYREACALLLLALLRARDDDAPPPLDAAAFDRVTTSVDERDRDELRAVRDALTSTDPLFGDALAPDDAEALRAKLVALAARLRRVADPRTPARVRAAQFVRVGAGAVAVGGLAVWGTTTLLAPTNIALHKHAVGSSLRVEPQGTGVTNGVLEASYGLSTDNQEQPWILIDLGEPVPIGGVKVYNRGDQAFDDCLPLVLELSGDGKSYSEVDRRETSFTQFRPWYSKRHGEVARYVRLRLPKYGYLALAEIEVFGR